MFSSACLNLPIGMRMHNIGRAVKRRAYATTSSRSDSIRQSALLVQLRHLSSGSPKRLTSTTTNEASSSGRMIREDWMVNMGRSSKEGVDDNSWLCGPRPYDWWTGKHPSNCPGYVGSADEGQLRSLPLPHLGRQTRASTQAYFDNSWCLTETLFAGLNGEEGFYRPPPHGLRHPQIFYYGHGPCVYVNKLRVAGVLDSAVDPYLESIFEVGVDEMLWDDMHKNDMVWPTVAEVHAYRKQVYDKVTEVIAEHPDLASASSQPHSNSSCSTTTSVAAPTITRESSPLWALYMGFEHERIHLETSSVLFREMPSPLKLMQTPKAWPALHPSATSTNITTATASSVAVASTSSSGGGGGDQKWENGSNTNPVEGKHFPANKFLPCSVGGGDGTNNSSSNISVALGKPDSFPTYGWDNEYGRREVSVHPFKASKYLVSNGEFFQFVASGGYRESRFWSSEGWAWRRHRNLKAPFFWTLDGPSGSNRFKLRTIFEEVDMPWSWPAEVTYYEAKAFAKWKAEQDQVEGTPEEYRLLTEAEHHCLRHSTTTTTPSTQLESSSSSTDSNDSDSNINQQDGTEESVDRVLWCPGEHFADPTATHAPHTGTTSLAANSNLAFGSCSPVDSLPPTSRGHFDVMGNAWQWTEDHFNPLEGFEVHPFYDDFSSPCFDGRHHLIMGGSFVSTGAEASVHARFHFRPHFLQHSGFRLVSQAQGHCPATRLMSTPFSPDGGTQQAREVVHAAENVLQEEKSGENPGSSSKAAAAKKVSGTGVVISGGDDEVPVYESQALLDMYLALHFPASGSAEGVPSMLPHQGAPDHALRFPQRVAQLLVRHASLSNPTKITRALDVGCAVGGSSFELAKHFDQVVGFDFSSSFVGAANAMKCGQDVDFTIPIEGDFKVQVRASHEPGVDEGVRSRTSFHTGDACKLLARFQDQDPLLLMGITPNDDDCDDAGFDGVVVANLLCRLPQPRLFLDGLSAVLKPGGVAVVVTPYSWLDEFTPREEWLGGTVNQITGLPVAAKDVLTREMAERGLVKIDEEQLPLVIREHQRKFQYIISEATVWRKEAASTK